MGSLCGLPARNISALDTNGIGCQGKTRGSDACEILIQMPVRVAIGDKAMGAVFPALPKPLEGALLDVVNYWVAI